MCTNRNSSTRNTISTHMPSKTQGSRPARHIQPHPPISHNTHREHETTLGTQADAHTSTGAHHKKPAGSERRQQYAKYVLRSGNCVRNTTVWRSNRAADTTPRTHAQYAGKKQTTRPRTNSRPPPHYPHTLLGHDASKRRSIKHVIRRPHQPHKPCAETKHIQETHRLFLSMGPTRSTSRSENSSYLSHGLRKFPYLGSST